MVQVTQQHHYLHHHPAAAAEKCDLNQFFAAAGTN
jgi:hypothetical protein